MIPWKCATCREKQPPLVLLHVRVELGECAHELWLCKSCRRDWQQPEVPRAEVRP